MVTLSIPAGALFNVNGQTQSIASLNGAGNVNLGSGGSLTITGASGTFSGGVSGSGTVTLSAAGTAVWTGASSYTGSFSHLSGELNLIGGSVNAPFTQSAGTFGMASNATAGAVTINGGVFWPGHNGTGIVNTGNLTLAAAAIYREPLDGPAATSYGNTHVTGAVSLGGATLNLQGSAIGVSPGTMFVIIDNDGSDPIVGSFAGLPQGTRITGGPGGLDYAISYTGGTGNDVVLTALAPAIPALDPRSLIALGLALAAIALFILRR